MTLAIEMPTDGEWILKGGFALQFRYGLLSRPTRDVDFRTRRDLPDALESLRRSVSAVAASEDFASVQSDDRRWTGGGPNWYTEHRQRERSSELSRAIRQSWTISSRTKNSGFQ